MNNRWLRGALSAALITMIYASAQAAPALRAVQEPNAQHQGRPGGRGPVSPEQQLADLTKTLQLTDKQQSEVATILQNQRQQMETLRNNAAAGDRKQSMSQMRSLENDTDAKLKAVLSKEQYEKYQAQKPQRGSRGSRPEGGNRGGRA